MVERCFYVSYTEDGASHFYSGIRAGAVRAEAERDDFRYGRIGGDEDDE